MKILILDSGSLINFSMNGLTDLLRDLRKNFSGRFIITKEVKYETIDRPLKIKRFELEALRLDSLLKEGAIEMPLSIGISDWQIKEKASEILRKANNSFLARGEFMHIIDTAEASCLALSLILNEKGIDNLIAIDERTTRMLGENPENLRKLFESKLHTGVKLEQDFSYLKNVRFIRSAELVYIAYKKGLVKLKNHVLEALLYATKFKGCSISNQEIQEAKNL